MKKAFKRVIIFFIILTVGLVATAKTSPQSLQTALKSDDPPTVIDLRSTALFQKGHIPGAINIAHRVVDRKRLPALGRVIVYGDGLGLIDVQAAVDALNRKPGIQAEALTGGYAAWRTLIGSTTEGQGAFQASPQFISYNMLLQMRESNIVLVDLIGDDESNESNQKASIKGKAAALQKSSDAVSRLSQKLNGVSISSDPLQVVSSGSTHRSKAKATAGSDIKNQAPPLLILIDRNDGMAAAAARNLRAKGYYRFVILLGGEEMINREGRTGLRRESTILSVEQPQTISENNSSGK